jgi:hypothetical protein
MQRRFIAQITFAFLCSVCIIGKAQPFGSAITLQIGLESIQIPTPQGFVETSRRSQELWNTALSFSAGDARIAAHFVSEQDMRSFEGGKTVVFKQFMLVQTPSRAESIVVSQAQFDKLRASTADLQRNLASSLEPRMTAELEKVSKALSKAQGSLIKLRLGEIVPVSVDRNDMQILSYTVLSQVGASDSKNGSGQNMVATTSYCFIRGKVVILTSYRHFTSPQDLQASRESARAWANALLAAN